MSKLVRFGISMEKKLLNLFDKIIKKKNYPNRSEAIRDLVRNYIVEEEKTKSHTEMIGTLSIVYDHHKRELSEQLIELQHQVQHTIACSLHLHLDRHNCMEVIIIKGTPKSIQKIADKLISTKGVKHGKLTITSTGKELV